MPNSDQQFARRARTTPPDVGAPTADAQRVAPVVLHSLIEESIRLNRPTAPLFRGLGFTAEDLDQPGLTVAHQEAVTVTRRALQAFGHPSLGLRLGMRSRLTNRGVLALGLLASPTLKASVNLMLRFPASAGFLLDVRAVESPERFAIVAESMGNHDLTDFLVDKLFAGLVRQMRQISETDCSPRLVELMRPARVDVFEHEHHYRGPVRFNCSANRLVFDPKTLSGPLPMASTMSLRIAEMLLDRGSLDAHPGSMFGLAVRRAIASALPHTPTTGELASRLHLSERSLRRKLAQENLSFRGLLDESRRIRALDLLTSGQRSITEAAAEAGFSDTRSFRRALRRWTADAPAAPPRPSDADGREGEPDAG